MAQKKYKGTFLIPEDQLGSSTTMAHFSFVMKAHLTKLFLYKRQNCTVAYSAALFIASRTCARMEIYSFGSRRTTYSICYQPILNLACNRDKSLLYIDIIFCWSLPKVYSKLFRQFWPFFRGYDLIVKHITLVSNKNLVYMYVCMLLNLGDPVSDRFEGAAVCYVVH